MSFDFTLRKYRELCEAVANSTYTPLTVEAFLTAPKAQRRYIVLRHDVDRLPGRALQMARLEHELGIKASYYFRFNRRVFKPHIVREIASMGHEVGYHYETMDKTKGNYERAIELFRCELEEIRKIVPVKTICMHGNPMTQWDNRDLWNKYDFKSFGLVGEAYLSFGNITYLSDTGRTWDSRRKIKDWLPAASSNQSKDIDDIIATSTDDIIELVKKEELGSVYVLVHSERWNDNLFSWISYLALDTGVNLAKRILALRERKPRRLSDQD